ncbi:MAG: biosynthetic-type acetolactate synthase large subunit [Treponema sp.]|jgi:acetolactate synthase-1/2/3 large subunit|nr:biosynthetic-type acetolactate synthase large subunit [Treponema sp.]
MRYTGARILIEVLVEQGVDTVFGYPGAAVLHIYDELYRQRGRIRHILTSHEQHAAHAADGYARSTGKTGVCIATSGPGATNLITGIAAAFMDSSPLVAITGNVATSLLGKDSFQEVDIAGISMPVVKHNWIVKDPGELAETVREAFAVAGSGRKGPVLIDIPRDVAATEAEWTAGACPLYAGAGSPPSGAEDRARRLAGRSGRRTFTGEDIERAAGMLSGAKRPVLYAGGGVISSAAHNELAALAERLDAPVAVSLMGMGAVPSDHRLCTGLVGMHGTAASNKAVQKADLLAAIGVRFSDRVTSRTDLFAKNARILHIDIDPAEVNKNVHADASVIGDVREVLSRLLEIIPPGGRGASAWNGEIERWKAIVPKDYHRQAALHPRRVILETARRLGDGAIVTADVGQHQMWTAQFYPFSRPRSFLTSGGLGAMGFGLGAAAGAKIANPGRPVVLFTGDGCFRMNSAEMATLVSFGIPVLIVLFNNGVLGMVRQWQEFFYGGRYSETDLPAEPDFVKLAAAYGVKAYRAVCEKSLGEALDSAFAELPDGKPVLVEAVIDRDERVFPMVPGGTPIDEQIM